MLTVACRAGAASTELAIAVDWGGFSGTAWRTGLATAVAFCACECGLASSDRCFEGGVVQNAAAVAVAALETDGETGNMCCAAGSGVPLLIA